MGLFDKLGRGSEIQLTPHGALLLAVITMIAIDGDIDEDELAILRRIDRNNKSDKDFNDAVKIWKKKTIDECIDIVNSTLNEEQKVTAIANLVDVSMADGVLDGDEKTLLQLYVDKLGVKSEIVESIVEVVAIKNKSLL